MSTIRHLLSIRDLSKEEFLTVLHNAHSMAEIADRELKKVPALRGKTIVNLFYESSTRTRTSFEIAGKRLSADVVNISTSTSSVTKGETLLDTARTLQAMAPDILVVRHGSSGAPHFLASHLSETAVINAGDGTHEHPTQALLDCLTLQQYFGKLHGSSSGSGSSSASDNSSESDSYSASDRARHLEGLCVAIVGDIRHSRVARSNMWAHLMLGNEVRLVGPPTLVPHEFGRIAEESGERYPGRVRIMHSLSEGLSGAHVVIALRMQLERQHGFFVPTLEEYSREYCISMRALQAAHPAAVVLSPGPANRGIEISSEVLDGDRCLATSQVTNGVAVRMAVLYQIAAALQRGAGHDSH